VVFCPSCRNRCPNCCLIGLGAERRFGKIIVNAYAGGGPRSRVCEAWTEPFGVVLASNDSPVESEALWPELATLIMSSPTSPPKGRLGGFGLSVVAHDRTVRAQSGPHMTASDHMFC